MCIDWQAPWLSHIDQQLHTLSTTDLYQQLNTHDSGLLTGLGKPLQFVPQSDLPEDTAYETHIAETGQIPTRDNLHDLFNACVWLTFPKTKAMLNAYQHQEILTAGVKQRTKLRDAITLFDENGALLVTSEPPIGDALTQFDWQNSLVTPRARWDHPKQPRSDATAAVYLFGHALMEQLVEPRKPLCAHTWVIQVAPDWFKQSLAERMASLDLLLSTSLQNRVDEDALHTRSYQPLPVLGVPHFWAENEDAKFYDDNYVFRSGRRKK